MEKSIFTVEDFVLDSDFRDWILYPNRQRNLRWDIYLENYPERIREIQLAREIVLNFPKPNHAITEEEASSLWNQIEGKLDPQETELPSAPVPISSQAIIRRRIAHPAPRKFNIPLIKIAALFLLVVGLGILYYSLPEREIPKQINWLTYSTKPGVKSSITLGDGTKVTLNAGTSIRYIQNFVGDTREVFLDGEAFFEVAHDTLKPFIVHTQDIKTKALGTSFNVKGNSGEKIAI